MKQKKYVSLTQVIEQNPVSCGNCSHFKTKKGIHKLYARCTLGVMDNNKKYWAIERQFLRMPLSWENAKRCRHFDGEAIKE
ncbi:MAG: hypothetical protein DDT22_00915 [candidate division WS2 bacterium]|nr:hypothetical protein [Candidatus Lithacetigena glycinireducens]